MNGSEWLVANAGQLRTDCPIGRITVTACMKRVEALKKPGHFGVGIPLNRSHNKCFDCEHGGFTDETKAKSEFELWELQIKEGL